MKKTLFSLLLLALSNLGFTQISEQSAAQEAERNKKMEATMAMETSEGWQKKGGVGFDIGQLINLNPYIGAGSNRIGLGGAIAITANYTKSRLNWKNSLAINLSTQRIGSGTVDVGSNDKLPFEKALDIFSIGSNVAYQIKEGSAWAYSLDLGLVTQLLGSHVDSASNKIYLKEVKGGTYNTSLKSAFMSPGLLSLAPGIKYTASKHFNVFVSPCGGKMVIIGNQKIADLGIHGTEKNDNVIGYKRIKFELGALAKLGYAQTIYKKVQLTSELSLFSNYLNEPQNIDVNWLNSLSVELFKGLNIGVQGNVYYDHDRINNITDSAAVGGFSGQGKRVNFIEQLLITYNRSF